MVLPSKQFWNPILGLPGSRSPGACYLVGLLVPVLGSSLGPILALSSEATQTRTSKELMKVNPFSSATDLWAFESSSGVLSILPFRGNIPTFFSSSLGNVVSNVHSLGSLSNFHVKLKVQV